MQLCGSNVYPQAIYVLSKDKRHIVFPLEVFIYSLYEGGSESSVIGIITLLINMIGCCIIP